MILLAGAGYLAVASSSPFYFIMVFLGYTWMALLYACLLLIVITANSGLIVGFVRLAPLRNLGIVSYSVYLMHLSVNMLMHGLILGREVNIVNLTTGAVTIMAFLTTLLLATLSWHFFEKPIIRWGHSFSYGSKKPAGKAEIALP